MGNPVNTVSALSITDRSEIQVTPIRPILADLQAEVGGFLECVTLDEAGTHMYLDEEGKISGKRINVLASLVVEHFKPGFMSHDVIVGDVILLGMTSAGEEADLPLDVVELVTLMRETMQS